MKANVHHSSEVKLPMAKKKPSYLERRQKVEQMNKKAIIWVAAGAGTVVVVLSLLLALDI